MDEVDRNTANETLSSTTTLEKTLPLKSTTTTRPTTAIDAAVSIASTLKHSMDITSRQPQFLQSMEDRPRNRQASPENWRRASGSRSKQRARTSERLTRKAEAEKANAEEEKVEEITSGSLFFTDDDVPLTFNKSRWYTDDPTMRRMIELKEQEEREAKWAHQMSIASTNTPSAPDLTQQRLLNPIQSPDGRPLSRHLLAVARLAQRTPQHRHKRHSNRKTRPTNMDAPFFDHVEPPQPARDEGGDGRDQAEDTQPLFMRPIWASQVQCTENRQRQSPHEDKLEQIASQSSGGKEHIVASKRAAKSLTDLSL
ncbi:hypothetical protein BLNAU_4894 [Blattamonas nauphoetae]|uniref:Uncharacterized protein n=1 Tax=Blattamonas nauphoetae TaxID=2049346 RepID=A0ABQ9Y8B6_9EUKA|nr:hypothetical protein BLNAU_4894 [Blattamonas nauphoetae]